MAKPSVFSLREGHWFAYQLIPGPGPAVCSYFSPILVLDVQRGSRGDELFRLGYLDAFHPGGVTKLDRMLRVLKQTSRYLIASDVEGGSESDESMIVAPLSFDWLGRFATSLLLAHPPTRHTAGSPPDVQFFMNRLYA